MDAAATGRRIYYGWFVVASLSVSVFLVAGLRFANGPFLKPIAAELGTGRAAISFVLSFSLLLYGGIMPLTGRLVDRYGPRLVMVGGSLIMTAALVGMAFITEYWQMFLLYGLLVSVGTAGTSQVTCTAVATNWFHRRRGLATSLVAAAAMGSMAIFTPLITYIILWLGWRNAYLVLAAPMVLVVLPLALWVIRRRPEDMGLLPDGDEPAAPVGASGGAGGTVAAAGVAAGSVAQPGEPGSAQAASGRGIMSAREFLRNRQFWYLAGEFFTCGYSMNLFTVHGQPMLTDRGIDPMVASSIVGLLGLVSLFGTIGIGAMSDRLGRKRLLALICLTRAVAFIVFITVRNPVYLFAFAATAGFFWSGTSSMTSSLTADIFGRRSVGTIFGSLFVSHQIGAAVSSFLGGLFFDLTGSYVVPFTVTVLVLIGGAVSSLMVQEPRGEALKMAPALGRAAG